MHMADGLLSPPIAGTMYACSIVAAAYSIRKVKAENDDKKIPLMGIMAAFVFAAQMINFTIPGTGSSGHLGGGMLLSAILGPYAGFLSMIAILFTQALFFADGGLLALGSNIWNMAFYGCFIGAFVIWRMFMRKRISDRKIITASIIGSIVTLQLGAFSVTLQTLASGVTQLPFSLFAGTMLPIHLAIGLVEGLITSSVLIFINHARPELLWKGSEYDKALVSKPEKKKLSFTGTVVILLMATLLTGGGLSLLASSRPDGLEWSIHRVSGLEEVKTPAKTIYSSAEKIQKKTAILPDYAFKKSDSGLGTSFSGILGSIIVIVFCFVCSYAFRFFRKKTKHE